MSTRMDTVDIGLDVEKHLEALKQEMSFERALYTDLAAYRKSIEDDLIQARYNAFKQELEDEQQKELKVKKQVEIARGRVIAQQRKQLLKQVTQYEEEYQKQLDEAKTKLKGKKLKARQKELEEEKNKRIEQYKEQLKAEEEAVAKSAKKKAELQEKAEQKAKRKQNSAEEAKKLADGLLGAGKTPTERWNALYGAFHPGDSGKFSIKAGLGTLTNAISDIAVKLKSDIDSISRVKGEVDTRLQGSKHATGGGWFGIGGSYWDNISTTIKGAAGVSPLVKQEDVVTNLKSMVNQGISYNIEQRAFLETMKNKIATTFSATNGTLLRLIRIQQQDTTAARLGMESAINAFLNNMYETTEYMGSVMDGIKSSLEEAEALMGTKSAAAFEYQVQKWMGSMYSVGMSDSGVRSIANALGQIAAGNISGLTGQGTGNLVVMAANNIGLPLDQILSKGLTDNQTNTLMKAMVEYLAGIYEESKDSKVIQQQYANVFGLTASDLKAISNLSVDDVDNINKSTLSYDEMLNQLTSMANSMWHRSSVGEMTTNALANFKYTTASGIANNPVLYATYELASMLDSLVGGIAIPTVTAAGFGVDLETTVANLMRTGALAGGLLSGLGTIITAGGAGGITGSGILKALGIGSNLTTVTRGNGNGLWVKSGNSLSESGSIVGNSAGDDIYNKTMTDASDSADQQLIEARENEDTNEVTMSTVNENVVMIYQLLERVIDGSSTFKVELNSNYSWN